LSTSTRINDILPMFAADRMLGKLCKWLRILGFDCADVSIDSREQIMGFRLEGRLVLTRTTRWRHEEGVFWVAENSPPMQLRALVTALGIASGDAPLLQRCLRCNHPLNRIPKHEVLGRAPEYVYNSHDRFYACPSCERLYWSGSHLQNMVRQLCDLFGGSSFSAHSEEDPR
jgi:uncharacterized protein with PIN domain